MPKIHPIIIKTESNLISKWTFYSDIYPVFLIDIQHASASYVSILHEALVGGRHAIPLSSMSSLPLCRELWQNMD